MITFYSGWQKGQHKRLHGIPSRPKQGSESPPGLSSGGMLTVNVDNTELEQLMIRIDPTQFTVCQIYS